MTQDILTDAVTSLDTDILANYEAYRTATRSPKQKRRLWQWGAVAASFLLVIFAGLWFFAPMSGVNSECLYLTLLDPPDNEDYVMEYQYEMHHSYRAEPAVLALRKGAFFMENDTTCFYRLKGTDDLTMLVAEQKNTGELYLCRFCGFSLHMLYEDAERPMPSLGEVWSLIFGAADAEDIRRVTFEQSHTSCAYEREIPIPEVTLTAEEDIAHFYSLMAPLSYDGDIRSANLVECTSGEYLDGKAPLTVQTARRVTVEFKSGKTMTLDLYAADGFLRIWNFAGYAASSDALAWLIEIADIDLAYRDYGTVKEPPKGAHDGRENEVISPPSAPVQIETEKPIDVGMTD